MSEVAKYDAYKKKLQGVCDENNLTFRIRNNEYPITLTIQPVCGLEEQTSLLPASEEGDKNSPNAAIVFAFRDGDLAYKMSETFTISDVLFNKIKNLFKNLHSLWLQYFFRDVIGKGTVKAPNIPDIDKAAENIADDENGDGADAEGNDDSILDAGDIPEIDNLDDDDNGEDELYPDDYEYDPAETDGSETDATTAG